MPATRYRPATRFRPTAAAAVAALCIVALATAAGPAAADSGPAADPSTGPVITALTAAQTAPGSGLLSAGATLAGGQTPTGTLTFTLFGPYNQGCQYPTVVWNAPVDGDGVYTTPAFKVTTAGRYNWEVGYSGDSDNAGYGPTACGADGYTVPQATLLGRAYGLSATVSALGATLVDVPPRPDTGQITTTESEITGGQCLASTTDLIDSIEVCSDVATEAEPPQASASAETADGSLGGTIGGLDGLPLIGFSALDSTSTTTCTGSTGTTTISALSVNGVPLITQPTQVGPDTLLSADGITLALNYQVATPDGLTVTGLHIATTGPVDAEIDIAVSSSGVTGCG